MFNMLERILHVQKVRERQSLRHRSLRVSCTQAVKTFLRLADISDDVPTLDNGRRYGAYELSDDEWKLLALIKDVLQVCHLPFRIRYSFNLSWNQDPHTAIENFGSEKYPTMWKTLGCIEFLQSRWEHSATEARMAPLRTAIQAGLENFGKWYRRMDNTDAHVVALCKSPANQEAYFACSCLSSSQSSDQISVFQGQLDRGFCDSRKVDC
jgi:hypothetical protein